MKIRHDRGGFAAAIGAVLLVTMPHAQAATISRLTPPSELFASGRAEGRTSRASCPASASTCRPRCGSTPVTTLTDFQFTSTAWPPRCARHHEHRRPAA